MSTKLKEYLVTFPSSVLDTGYYEYRVAAKNTLDALKRGYEIYCDDDDVRGELEEEQGTEDGAPEQVKLPTLAELIEGSSIHELVPHELEADALTDRTKTFDVTLRFQVTAGNLEGAYGAAYDYLSEGEAEDFATGIIIDEVLTDAS